MWRRLTVRVSSWGALAKIEMAEADWSSWRNHAMNCEMPACATSPTCERSSAERSRYQTRFSSIRRTASVESSPALRSTASVVEALTRCRDGGVICPA